MLHLVSAVLFSTALLVAASVIVLMFAAEYRRILAILHGDRLSAMPRSVLPAPIRLTGRRWRASRGPSRAAVLRAAA